MKILRVTLGGNGYGPGFFVSHGELSGEPGTQRFESAYVGTEQPVYPMTPREPAYADFADYPLHSVHFEGYGWTPGAESWGTVENSDGVTYHGKLHEALPSYVLDAIDPSRHVQAERSTT